MTEQATICFLTRCHPARPKMLAACIKSVEAQTCKDYQHILIRDDTSERGYGLIRAEEALKKPWPINARYVMVLDDDNMLVDMDFVRVFKRETGREEPDIVFFRSYIQDYGVLPPLDGWGKPPAQGFIDYFCYAVSLEFWKLYHPQVETAPHSDFLLAAKCHENARRILWLDRFVARTQGLMARIRAQEDLP
jgi:glycosyltransferase involved in cell wall biosynthesis